VLHNLQSAPMAGEVGDAYVQLPSLPVADSVPIIPGEASITAEVINLVKILIGAGVLALPSGVATFSDELVGGMSVSIVLLWTMALLSCYTFWVIGRVCLRTKQFSYKGAFSKLYGKTSGRWVTMGTVILTLNISFMYSMIISDTARDIAAAIGIQGFYCNRQFLLGAMTLGVVVPLCLLRSLSALLPFSVLGVIGGTYTAAFCLLRFHEGLYAPGGKFLELAPRQPIFGESGTQLTPVFVLLSMLATTFMSHFSAPRFIEELKEPTELRFGIVSVIAFGISALLCTLIMCFGFLTFGGACQGLILDNYAVSDDLAFLARICTLASVVFSMPLIVASCRDDLLQLLCKKPPNRRLKNQVTMMLLASSTTVGLVTDNLGLAVALTGSVLGCTIVFVLPALMLVGDLHATVCARKATCWERFEYHFNQLLVLLGVALAMLGGLVTLISCFDPQIFHNMHNGH